jgi:hypothetical protein
MAWRIELFGSLVELDGFAQAFRCDFPALRADQESTSNTPAGPWSGQVVPMVDTVLYPGRYLAKADCVLQPACDYDLSSGVKLPREMLHAGFLGGLSSVISELSPSREATS